MKVIQPTWHSDRARILLTRLPLLGIVLHDTAGSGTHGDTLYLRDSPEKNHTVSVDFTVERDGAIWKLNPDLKKFACAHAGRHTKFKGKTNGTVTRSTIGIEIVQHVTLKLVPVWPAAQVAAVAILCAWLVQDSKLAPADIVTHRQIITDGSRSDPRQFPFDGVNGFWHRFWEAQGLGQKYLDSLILPPAPGTTPKTYTVKKGDSFYSIGRNLGVDPAALAEVNGLTFASVIVPGQVLKVP